MLGRGLARPQWEGLQSLRPEMTGDKIALAESDESDDVGQKVQID